LRGGDVEYVPLFLGFPDDFPEDDKYFAKRIVGYLGSFYDLFPEGKQLETGITVPEWLFDLKQFGADPVSQMQTKSLWTRAKEKLSNRKVDTHTEWIDLKLGWAEDTEQELKKWFETLVYAKSSIKEELREDLILLLINFGVDEIDFIIDLPN